MEIKINGTFWNLKAFAQQSKQTKWKDNPQIGRKIFENDVTNKGLVSKIYG